MFAATMPLSDDLIPVHDFNTAGAVVCDDVTDLLRASEAVAGPGSGMKGELNAPLTRIGA